MKSVRAALENLAAAQPVIESVATSRKLVTGQELVSPQSSSLAHLEDDDGNKYQRFERRLPAFPELTGQPSNHRAQLDRHVRGT